MFTLHTCGFPALPAAVRPPVPFALTVTHNSFVSSLNKEARKDRSSKLDVCVLLMQWAPYLVLLGHIFTCSYFPYTIERLRAKQGLSGLCRPFSYVAMKQNSILVKASHLTLNTDCTSKTIHTFTRIVFLRRCMSDLTSSLVFLAVQWSGYGGRWVEGALFKATQM